MVIDSKGINNSCFAHVDQRGPTNPYRDLTLSAESRGNTEAHKLGVKKG